MASLTEWSGIVSLAVSPLASIVLILFVYMMSRDLKEMKKALWGEGDNALVKRSELAREIGNVKEDIERLDSDLAGVSTELQRLERDKLSVRDYDREKAYFQRRR
jgi:biopolymer transport protein ExbB/TolQ